MYTIHQPIVHLLLVLLAVICAFMATINQPSSSRFSWFPASFLFYLIALFFV